MADHRPSIWRAILDDREERERQKAVAEHHLRNPPPATTPARSTEERAARAAERELVDSEHRNRQIEAADQTANIAIWVDLLGTILKQSVARRATTIAEIGKVAVRSFDPGEDGIETPLPTRPTMNDRGWIGRRRRQREFDQQMTLYASEIESYKRSERSRQDRLIKRRTEYDEHVSQACDAAKQHRERIETGISEGDETSVEEFAAFAIGRLPVPKPMKLDPRIAYRPEPREIVVEIDLPLTEIVPIEKTVTYIKSRKDFKTTTRPKAELNKLYESVIAQLPLAVIDSLFRGFSRDSVESLTVNGVVPIVDRATGQTTTDYLLSVTTARDRFNSLDLSSDKLEPAECLRALGAKFSPNPMAYESVPPYLTFDQAKYHLGPSIEVAAGLDGRTNLLKLDWPSFEQLVRELLFKLAATDVRVTRRSRDEGIDGVIFDCDAALGGEYIVQAKRYKNVVPANDVRALAGVLHDKRANHAIFVTTSWFSDDGRQFALANRVRLIEGPELKHLLRKHLELDVLIPTSRQRRRSTA